MDFRVNPVSRLAKLGYLYLCVTHVMLYQPYPPCSLLLMHRIAQHQILLLQKCIKMYEDQSLKTKTMKIGDRAHGLVTSTTRDRVCINTGTFSLKNFGFETQFWNSVAQKLRVIGLY